MEGIPNTHTLENEIDVTTTTEWKSVIGRPTGIELTEVSIHPTNNSYLIAQIAGRQERTTFEITEILYKNNEKKQFLSVVKTADSGGLLLLDSSGEKTIQKFVSDADIERFLSISQ
jgi:hypothetical protein